MQDEEILEEEIFEEDYEETEVTTTVTTEVITETVTDPFTEETTVFDEYGLEVVTSGTELDVLCSQVSELNSYAAVTAENTTAIKAQTEIEVILLFAVIAFCGMVCGLLSVLTWRSNKNG